MVVTSKREPSPNHKLKHERELRGWSQAKLAEKIGASCATVNRWEQGVKLPTPSLRERLCSLFGKNTEELGLLPRDSAIDNKPSLQQSSMLPVSFALPPNPATPPPLTLAQGLVGRDELLASLKQHLCDGEIFASTATAIYGLPGVGKTILALTLAHDQELREHFPDETLWVSLGPNPDVLGLLGRWGVHLGIVPAELSNPTRSEAWAQAIFSAIGRRRMLLIIDDAWDIKSALAFRVAGPGCAHLLTTRFPEVALQFAPHSAIVVHELTEEDGLKLLMRFAPEVVRSEPKEAQNLVQNVGGLPLALTIMGNYLRVQAHSGQQRRVQNALLQLHHAEKRLSLSLPRGPIESPNALVHIPLSLQSTIEISYQQLTREARRTLCLLSLFPAKPNTFSEEAVLAICEVPATTLDELTDIGFLEGSRPGRYMLHQTLADYATLRFSEREPEEQRTVREKLVVFFTSYAQEHAAEHELLELEESNILVALQKAYEQNMRAALVRGANGLAPFLIARGSYNLAEIHMGCAQEAALFLHDEQALARTWLYVGQVAEERGDLIQADQRYSRGLAIARKIKQREIICDLLTRRGEVRINQGEFILARKDLQQGLTFARKIGHPRRICILLRILGELFDNYGDYAQSDQYYQEGLTLAHQVGDWETVSALLQNLGMKSEWCGAYEEAETLYQAGLAIAHQIKHQQMCCGLLMHLGGVAMRQKRYEQAERLYQESLQCAHDIGARRKISAILQKRGILAYECGNWTAAEQYLTESLDLAYATGDHRLIIETLNEEGELRLKQQLVEEAQLSFTQARDMAEEGAIRRQAAIALFGLARLAALEGNLKDAESWGQKSKAIFKELKDEREEQVMQWLQKIAT